SADAQRYRPPGAELLRSFEQHVFGRDTTPPDIRKRRCRHGALLRLTAISAWHAADKSWCLVLREPTSSWLFTLASTACRTTRSHGEAAEQVVGRPSRQRVSWTATRASASGVRSTRRLLCSTAASVFGRPSD